jgi:surface protein
MGILKNITDEYFGKTERQEDGIERHKFTDKNGTVHEDGFYIPDGDHDKLEKLVEKLIKLRGDNADLNDIDVSNIKDMSHIFGSIWDTNKKEYVKLPFETFNGNISGWDVSKVENMEFMFRDAKSFNSDITKWDVSNVTRMYGMFIGCYTFNQQIGDWKVSNVESMGFMFCDCHDFNKELNSWKTKKVFSMSYMFHFATLFNQPIDNWDTSNVKYMDCMFNYAESFNQNLSKWDLNGKDTTDMFYGCPIKDEYKPKM